MLISILLEVGIILVLMLANGFFAASEIAMVSARKGRLEQKAAAGERGAVIALELAENPNHFLSTVQVGITVIGTFAAAFGGASLAEVLEELLIAVPATAPYASTIALASVVIIISYLSLIVGELVPKRLALQNVEGFASAVAPIMRQLSRLAAPVVWVLTTSTELVLRLLGRHKIEETPITEDDVLALVREGTAEGTLESAEQDLIANVFLFTDRSVRSLMTPRTQMFAVDIATALPELLELVKESGYSRIPVYEGSLDTVVGLLFVKDLLGVWGQPDYGDLRSLLREPTFVLESQRAFVAFQQLKQRRSGLALVVDEYGQISGLVTIEDFIEELVGDINDEHDEQKESLVQREDGSYLVDGLLPFVDLQERLRLPDVDESLGAQDFETVAGFVLVLLGRIPVTGDSVEWQGYMFEVIDMDGHRIDKILLRRTQQDSVQQSEGVLASRATISGPHNEGSGAE